MPPIIPEPRDIEAATAFVDGPYREGRDPEHHAFHREANIRRVAMLEAGKRLEAERKAAIEVWRTTKLARAA